MPPFWQFLDAIFGCLTKDVAGQYKVNAKKLDFSLMTCPGAAPCRFCRFSAKNGTVWRFFGLKKFQKDKKKFKKILNGLKIIVEQKEKRFWKA